jgi:alanine-glyoxylate transaminase/serine-glyoxylate transaminase/serine-pyruvate transaminase
VLRTQNPFTIAVSGTGSAGMEAALVNVVEPGDAVVVVAAGVFGNRMADIVGRCGGRLVKLDVPWGETIEPGRIEETLKKEGKVKAVALVHAETSTGAQQPMDGLGRLCRDHGALLVVDTVTSLGGVPVEVDAWEADAVYSGTQKCLSCPPGLAPLTLSQRALDAVKARKTKVQSWYLDAGMVADYWAEGKRVYHHTAPISMVYALRESLRLVLEEGLEARFARHRRHSAALMAGLGALGCEPQAQAGRRLPSLNCVKVPAGIDEGAVRKYLLAEHSIEIGGGLGPLAGKVWRIGLMGESSRQENVLAVLAAIEQGLAKQGKGPKPGTSLAAALDQYAKE